MVYGSHSLTVDVIGRVEIRRTAPAPVEKSADGQAHVNLRFNVLKVSGSEGEEDEERIVTGAVLVPGKIDAHGDLLPADVIRKAALDFGFRLNQAPLGQETAVAGVQHTDFTRTEKIRVVENYIAPADFELNGNAVLAGTWMLSVKVLDDEVWADVKDGKITGFSMGGMAEVERTEEGIKVAMAAEDSGLPYIVLAQHVVRLHRAEAQAAAA